MKGIGQTNLAGLLGLVWVGTLVATASAAEPALGTDRPLTCQAIAAREVVLLAGSGPRRNRPKPPPLGEDPLPLSGTVHLLLPTRDAQLEPGAIAFRWLPVATPGITYKITVRDEQAGTDLASGETPNLTWTVPFDKVAQFEIDRVYEVTVEALPPQGQDPLPRKQRLDSRRFQVRSIADRESLRSDLLGICRQQQPPRQQALALAEQLGASSTAIATLEAARNAAPVAGDLPELEFEMAIARLAIELGWREKALPAVNRARQVCPNADSPQCQELEKLHRLLTEQ